MANIDLITGFLGAGKTTFIRKYASFLRQRGESFAVIENEYGTNGIDSRILAAEGIETDELFGGCICCTLKVGFHKMLLELSQHFDRIIVEPSGVYDISQFYSVMNSPELSGKCNIGNIICVINPLSLNELDEFSKQMLKNQALASGAVIFSMNDKENNTKISEYTEKACCILEIDTLPVLEYNDFNALYNAGASMYIPHKETYHSAKYLSTVVKPAMLEQEEVSNRIKKLFCSTECGNILRIKGIWGKYLVNCVKDNFEIYPQKGSNGINIIGTDLSRKNIMKIINGDNHGTY
ncbi:MAG: hypothetical protein IKU52_08570 [Clostridia bacterium]|nr:hypothetical protein [Clostridia bacterium]